MRWMMLGMLLFTAAASAACPGNAKVLAASNMARWSAASNCQKMDAARELAKLALDESHRATTPINVNAGALAIALCIDKVAPKVQPRTLVLVVGMACWKAVQ